MGRQVLDPQFLHGHCFAGTVAVGTHTLNMLFAWREDYHLLFIRMPAGHECFVAIPKSTE